MGDIHSKRNGFGIGELGQVPEGTDDDWMEIPVAKPIKRLAKQRRMTCKSCGQSGWTGEYPFSTMPSSGYCDDCL